MTNEWEDVDIRAKALVRVESLGAAARPALLYVVAALNDSDREIRQLVERILPELCPNARKYAGLLDRAVESRRRQVRLAILRELSTVLPEITTAIKAAKARR